jgi:hypothetical protein
MANIGQLRYRSTRDGRFQHPIRIVAMLLSLTSLAVLFSTSASPLSGGVERLPIYADNAPVTPQDPSTLVLALIGAGTLAVYLAVRRRPSRFVARQTASVLPGQSEKRGVADGVEQEQSRGAA